MRTHPGQYGRKGAPHAQLPTLTLNIRTGNSLIDSISPSPVSLASFEEKLMEAAALSRQAKDVDQSAEKRREVLEALETSIHEVNETLLPNLLPLFTSNETLRQAIAQVGIEDDDTTVRAVRHYLITGSKPRALADTPDKTLAEVLEELRTPIELTASRSTALRLKRR